MFVVTEKRSRRRLTIPNVHVFAADMMASSVMLLTRAEYESKRNPVLDGCFRSGNDNLSLVSVFFLPLFLTAHTSSWREVVRYHSIWSARMQSVLETGQMVKQKQT